MRDKKAQFEVWQVWTSLNDYLITSLCEYLQYYGKPVKNLDFLMWIPPASRVIRFLNLFCALQLGIRLAFLASLTQVALR